MVVRDHGIEYSISLINLVPWRSICPWFTDPPTQPTQEIIEEEDLANMGPVINLEADREQEREPLMDYSKSAPLGGYQHQVHGATKTLGQRQEYSKKYRVAVQQ